ncbi:hypothetical protein GCM10027589_49090 [Actinocorallia lasiicapitis]
MALPGHLAAHPGQLVVLVLGPLPDLPHHEQGFERRAFGGRLLIVAKITIAYSREGLEQRFEVRVAVPRGGIQP